MLATSQRRAFNGFYPVRVWTGRYTGHMPFRRKNGLRIAVQIAALMVLLTGFAVYKLYHDGAIVAKELIHQQV